MLYSDKTSVLTNQSAQGLIYIINSDKTWFFDQLERAQGPIYVIIKLDRNTGYLFYFNNFTGA